MSIMCGVLMEQTKKVVVFGRSYPPCSFCDSTKQALDSSGIVYEYKDISEGANMAEFTEKYLNNGVRSVPQVSVDGVDFGGFDNIKKIISGLEVQEEYSPIEYIIKGDGSKVPFDPEKLNKKARWAAKRKVNWSGVALKALKKLQNGCSSKDIDKALIDTCVDMFDEKGFMLAGRILAGVTYKEAFGGFKKIPTLKQHHDSMSDKGYWEKLDYSEEEFIKLEEEIDHGKDLTYSYPEIKQIIDKYIIRDRVEDISLESPQMMYMGMAMANMKDMPKERRMTDVIKYYHFLSDKKICAPTPFMTNLRTPNRSFASCATFSTLDTAPSLAAGDHIAYMLTCASAGIGSHLKTRSKGDKVRGGTTVHQGKRPYYMMTQSAVAANLQSSRGGSATMHLNVLDPEVEDIILWKSKKTATKVRVDGIHYSIGYNRLFAQKVKDNEDWMLVSYSDNQDLYEAMYDGDQTKFEELYSNYETTNPKVKKVNARKLAMEILVQGQESGQIYVHRTDELNRHTPHKDKIYSSNLCQETSFPTMGFDSVFQLNEKQPVNKDGTIPEIGLCSLSAVVARRVSEEEWGEVAYYCALSIDNVMEIMDYPFKCLEYSAKARRNIGVGITDLAGHMAELSLKYSSLEGKQYIYRLAELHSFNMIKASLRLAEERGVCEWGHKTRWSEGWLPIDTMNSNVAKVIKQPLTCDWEGLRKQIKEVGGIRHSTLVNHMPNESSSVATNGTNSVLPARSIKTVKTNGSKKTRFLVPNSDTLASQYELAWDIKTKDLLDVYGALQSFCDQSISADIYMDFTKGDISGGEMLKDFLYQTAIGMKTRYYVNSKTNSGNENTDNKEKDIVETVEDVGCDGGGCTL